MPRGVRSTSTIPTDPPAHSAAFPGDEAFDTLMAGLPEEQKMIEGDRLAGEPPAAPVPPGWFETIDEDKVLLVNLRYREETVFVPERVADRQGNERLEFVGQKQLGFIDGHLFCTREQADFVKSICPYVMEEPKEGEVATFDATGFQTRSPVIMADYARRWGDNQ
jgi:hypothetical protein